MVQKGCWTGPTTGQMESNDMALPPDYSVMRGCETDLCNAELMTHDVLPNLSAGVPGGGAGGEARGGRGGASAGLRPAVGPRAPRCGARSALPNLRTVT